MQIDSLKMEVFSPREYRRPPEGDLSIGILTEDEVGEYEADEGGGGGSGFLAAATAFAGGVAVAGGEGDLITKENWLVLDRLITLQDRFELPEDQKETESKKSKEDHQHQKSETTSHDGGDGPTRSSQQQQQQQQRHQSTDDDEMQSEDVAADDGEAAAAAAAASKKEEDHYESLAARCVQTVELIVEFVKRIPRFDELLKDDQITLLKVIERMNE